MKIFLPRVVAVMHAWVSIPHKMTDLVSGWAALNFSINSGRIMVKQVLEMGRMLYLASSISGTVGPRPLGYCSVQKVGTETIRTSKAVI